MHLATYAVYTLHDRAGTLALCVYMLLWQYLVGKGTCIYSQLYYAVG